MLCEVSSLFRLHHNFQNIQLMNGLSSNFNPECPTKKPRNTLNEFTTKGKQLKGVWPIPQYPILRIIFASDFRTSQPLPIRLSKYPAHVSRRIRRQKEKMKVAKSLLYEFRFLKVPMPGRPKKRHRFHVGYQILFEFLRNRLLRPIFVSACARGAGTTYL